MQHQLLIIGSGPGGYRAAAYAARHGLQVAVVEEDKAGGTCLNRGCIPTKTLCHEADTLGVLRKALPSARVDFRHVQERIQQVTDSLRQGVEQLLQAPGITLLRGHASFLDDHTVEVERREEDGTRVVEQHSADNIIIATGSLPKLPPGLLATTGPDGDVMDSTDLLSLDHVPERLCVVGAGVIGMEMASAFARFGAKVTVVEFLRECLPSVDADIAKRLRKSLERQGIDFVMQAAVKGVERRDDGTRIVNYEDKKGRAGLVEADAVLVATGRRPNTDGLRLEATGVALGGNGNILVDHQMQTNIPVIYAIGDANGRQMLAHAATMQGMVAVDHILANRNHQQSDPAMPIQLDIMPAAIFTQPECACVGLTEQQAQEQGLDCECRKSYYRASGRALAMDETDGMVKLLSERCSGRLLGCHAYGAHAADLVQEVAALMCLNATVSQLAAITHIHPTLGELLQDAALN